MKTNQKIMRQHKEQVHQDQRAILLDAIERSLLLDIKVQGTLLAIITVSIL